MVVFLDDGPIYARNLQRLTKYTKNKLCMKVVFLYTIIARCTVNKTLKKKPMKKSVRTVGTWPEFETGRHTSRSGGSFLTTLLGSFVCNRSRLTEKLKSGNTGQQNLTSFRPTNFNM